MGMILFNFKDYLDVESSAGIAAKLSRSASKHKLIIAPSLTSLCKVRDSIKGRGKTALCAQDVDIPGIAGPYTGKTTISDLKSLGCSYALIGHSEVRHKVSPENGDSDELVAMKIRLALDSNLVPVLCFGETSAEKAAGSTKAVARRQIESALRHVKRAELRRIIFAYEPVWAIKGHSNAQACSIEYANGVIDYVRRIAKLDSSAKFLYGGSVDGKNARSYIDGGFFGVLVGRSGTHAEGITSILKSVG